MMAHKNESAERFGGRLFTAGQEASREVHQREKTAARGANKRPLI